jgi:hypothetical protein
VNDNQPASLSQPYISRPAHERQQATAIRRQQQPPPAARSGRGSGHHLINKFYKIHFRMVSMVGFRFLTWWLASWCDKSLAKGIAFRASIIPPSGRFSAKF